MGNYNRLLSGDIEPPKVFIGFDAKGNEVFGTEEERQAYLDYCEAEESKYGGDYVDYENSADISHLIRKEGE